MKKIIFAALFMVLGLAGGIAIERWMLGGTPSGRSESSLPPPPYHSPSIGGGGSVKKERKILYWTDPMIPGFRSDKPGKSPMNMDMVPIYEDEPLGGSTPGASTVTIAPEVVNNLGVRTAKVEHGTLARRIDTVGYLAYDESRLNHVHVRAEGWIQHLLVKTKGERVEKGQLLFELYSPTLVNAQEEYLQALAIGNQRLANASRQRLAALGISEDQIARIKETHKAEKDVRVYAHHHLGGVVADLLVREGMYLKPDTEIMTLVDLSSVWLLAEVFERQAGWVAVGQGAEAHVPSNPGKVWSGHVQYIYPDLDPVTRTLQIRLRFDNPEEILKPNMYAHVTILADPRPDVLSIPREALIRDGGSERVVLALGQGRFQPREVKAGIESGDRIEILEGLKEGDTVVVSSQFLLDSEASLKASFDRMVSPALAPGPSHD